MKCSICFQPVDKCGRTDRRAISFEIVMMQGYQNGVVISKSMINNYCFNPISDT